jgi:hypothetical protein
VSEFLAAFGPVLGAPVLDVRQLAEAAAWPADGEGELVAVYTALLRFLLAQWVRRGGGVGGWGEGGGGLGVGGVG